MAKGRKGKPGPSSVNPSSKGSTPTNVSPGAPGRSKPEGPIPGPGSRKKGAMAGALVPKFRGGSDATGAAGLVR